MLSFISGAHGFVGSAMQSYIELHSDELQYYPQNEEIDVLDKDKLVSMFSSKLPDAVIHLAAKSYVPESFENPEHTYRVNFIGTLHLLQALKEANFSGTFLYVGSSDVYGKADEKDLPFLETRPTAPRNPYSVSKVAAEALCYQWSQTENIRIIMVRPFNHIGPGQSPIFVVSDFAKQIASIKLGLSPPILNVGNIDVYRDFTDVRDVVRAYALLLKSGLNGEAYNICSEKAVSIRDIINKLIGISGVDIQIQTDQARLRPAEQIKAYGSCKKLKDQTGWDQTISLDQSLQDIYSYWEEKLKNG
ncbi:MAG: GDP-mannose 4,6-dehydratase [Gammaproteobacteria bacterium]|nr:GDP-mannose 4,6-dehydratase [Gammaproteobacteria bacterium]